MEAKPLRPERNWSVPLYAIKNDCWTPCGINCYLDKNGHIGIGGTLPTDRIDVNSSNGYDQLRLRHTHTPTAAGDVNGNVSDLRLG